MEETRGVFDVIPFLSMSRRTESSKRESCCSNKTRKDSRSERIVGPTLEQVDQPMAGKDAYSFKPGGSLKFKGGESPVLAGKKRVFAPAFFAVI